jgi:hypothetical protein
MALVKGTSCGFVTEAPIGDPGGVVVTGDNTATAFKDVSPAGAVKVTEIGWWCDNATEESNFEVAIYDHNSGDDNPEDIVGVSRTNAKGTAAGWKRVTGLDIAISAETVYWMAVQIDYTPALRTKLNYNWDVGESKRDVIALQATLPDPWGVSGDSWETMLGVYAVYETGGGPVILDFERKTRGVARGVGRGVA